VRAGGPIAAWLLLWSVPCWSWGPQGHRTIGAIADRLLTPAAQDAVRALLSEDRDKFGNSSGRTTLEAVSVWADELRATDAARSAWHYDDAPVCGVAAKARYCPGGQCNSEALKRLMVVAGDPRRSLRERNEALKWVVHLVGDLHSRCTPPITRTTAATRCRSHSRECARAGGRACIVSGTASW
jgi:S1/P1 Nuclease